MFYGREDDLQELDRLWRKSVPSLVTCRGRRRIGKSTLIEEFAARSRARILEIEGLPPQPNRTNDDQLDHFDEQLRAQSAWKGENPKGWYEAMLALESVLSDERTVVLLDEISWMGAQDPRIPGVLKTAWGSPFRAQDRRAGTSGAVCHVRCRQVRVGASDHHRAG